MAGMGAKVKAGFVKGRGLNYMTHLTIVTQGQTKSNAGTGNAINGDQITVWGQFCFGKGCLGGTFRWLYLYSLQLLSEPIDDLSNNVRVGLRQGDGCIRIVEAQRYGNMAWFNAFFLKAVEGCFLSIMIVWRVGVNVSAISET